MPIHLRLACAALPILAGLVLGEATVAVIALPSAADAYSPPPQPQDRYTIGRDWAERHHPEDADACPSVDTLFQSGCIAETRY